MGVCVCASVCVRACEWEWKQVHFYRTKKHQVILGHILSLSLIVTFLFLFQLLLHQSVPKIVSETFIWIRELEWCFPNFESVTYQRGQTYQDAFWHLYFKNSGHPKNLFHQNLGATLISTCMSTADHFGTKWSVNEKPNAIVSSYALPISSFE